MRKAISKILDLSLVGLACASMAAASHAAPTRPGNLLVTDLQANTLTEYTTSGSVVQRFSIPAPPSATEHLRDVVQGTDGRIHMFNGTFMPWMSTLDPATGGISNLTAKGWSTGNIGSYGSIATTGSHVFVMDTDTAGGEAQGIVRFDLSDGSFERFASGNSFAYLTLGLDGKLYAGGSVLTNGVVVFDPMTMTSTGYFELQDKRDIRGMAVDSAGNVYTADWSGRIQKRNAGGSVIASLSTGQNLQDIDIDSEGNIVVGSRFGTVYLTDSSLTQMTSFQIGSRFGPSVHVAFTSSVPEPATSAMGAVGMLAVAALARGRQRKHHPNAA